MQVCVCDVWVGIHGTEVTRGWFCVDCPLLPHLQGLWGLSACCRACAANRFLKFSCMWSTLFLLLLLGVSTFQPFNQYTSVYLLCLCYLDLPEFCAYFKLFHQVWGVLFQMFYPLFHYFYTDVTGVAPQMWRLNSSFDLHLDYRVFSFRILIREFIPLVPLLFKHYFFSFETGFYYVEQAVVCQPRPPECWG